MHTNVIIIGAGASGLMCAIEASRRSRKVAVIDHSKAPGQKILISGGGHCNFTNLNIGEEDYLSSNKHFVKSALARFTPQDMISLVKQHGISYFEKDRGEMFLKGSSRQILDMLLNDCEKAGIRIVNQRTIYAVNHSGAFTVHTNRGEFTSESLVIATGGLSYPKLGATDFGYRVAKQFGMEVTGLRPALVPFVFSAADKKIFGGLSGISLNAKVSCMKRSFADGVLFTHKGLSGPAILKISSLWSPGGHIAIDLFPDTDIFQILLQKKNTLSKITLKNILAGFFPERFAIRWCEANSRSRPVSSYSESELKKVAATLHSWTITPAKTEGYENAEVTLGGVATEAISSKTMESKKIRGLYFIGEVLDVTGTLGGFNLHWAWASGYAAGTSV